MRLAQTALFGVIGLLALLLVLRPMVARLTALAPGGLALGDGAAAAGGAAGGMLAGPGGGQAGIQAVMGPNGMMALPAPGSREASAAQLEDDALISLSQIEGQMRASSLRKLADIVSKHPDETLTIMRGWMAQEHG